MRGFWRPLSKAIALDGTVTRSHPLRFGTRWSSTTRDSKPHESLHDSNGSLASRVENKMDAHRLDIDRAREQIHETTQKADSYLTELTKRVDEYEQKHSNMEPATQYLKSALDASRSATQKLKTQGQDLSERTVPVALDGMQGVRESLDDLQKQAVAYDDKYAGSTGQQAIETLHHYVNSGRQLATDALETTTGQLTKLRDTIGNMAGQATHGAQVAVGETVRAAEFGDEKLGVTSMGSGVVKKVRDLDARLGVTAAAAKVDNTVTGGLGSKVASTTVGIVSESVNYITETLHNAKLAAEQSDTAQGVEAKGAEVTEAATKKKDEMKSTFNESVEHGKAKAGQAKDMAQDKAGQTKDMAQDMTLDKAGQAKDKAGEMKDMAAEKAGEAKDMAQEKAGQAKGKAGAVKDMATEKAGQAKDMAQDKVGQAKDKAGDMKDMAQEKAGKAKETTKEEAGQVKDMAQDKAGQAKETAKDKAGSAQHKVSESADQAKDTAGAVKEQTKAKGGNAKEQSEGIAGKAVGMAKNAKDQVKDQIGSAVDTATNLGTVVESKLMKPKEPTTTQEETITEKGLEGVKQSRAKESEAAKTAPGTARKELEGKQNSAMKNK